MPVAIGRRELIAALGGVVAAWPVSARAQQPAMPVVGLLLSGPPDTDRLAWFRHGLKEAGYVEGQNYSTEYRAANNRYERLPELATDLVRREVAVIVVPGTTAAALAAKAATRTIPIIFVIGSDPVEAGLVTSLARPGGNVTGLGALHFTMATKRLELLHEVVPTPALIALLVNPTNPYTEQETREVQAAAHGLGIQLRVLNAINEVDIDAAFAALVQQRIGAVLVGADPFFTSLRSQIVALAARYGVPAMYGYRDFTDAGGLMSYGPNGADTYRQLGLYTGRILKGGKPADLPVMNLTKFEFVINLKTAKALGLDVPLKLHAFADEVIE